MKERLKLRNSALYLQYNTKKYSWDKPTVKVCWGKRNTSSSNADTHFAFTFPVEPQPFGVYGNYFQWRFDLPVDYYYKFTPLISIQESTSVATLANIYRTADYLNSKFFTIFNSKIDNYSVEGGKYSVIKVFSDIFINDFSDTVFYLCADDYNVKPVSAVDFFLKMVKMFDQVKENTPTEE